MTGVLLLATVASFGGLFVQLLRVGMRDWAPPVCPRYGSSPALWVLWLPCTCTMGLRLSL
jgi:hypothetical protein